MAKQKISEAQRLAEGQNLSRHFNLAKEKDPDLTQESLAAEIGVTQGLIGQWMSGKTPIPDDRLVWLSNRFAFDPIEFRPGLLQFSTERQGGSNSRLYELIRQIPKDQEEEIADLLAQILSIRSKNQRSDQR